MILSSWLEINYCAVRNFIMVSFFMVEYSYIGVSNKEVGIF